MTTLQVTLSQAAIDVLAERQRQIKAEGYSVDHDLRYHRGELARAGAVYALSFVLGCVQPWLQDSVRTTIGWLWPWDKEWLKPDRGRRDLVKSCALLLAQIDHEDRLSAELRGNRNIDAITECHAASAHAAEFPREPDWDPQS